MSEHAKHPSTRDYLTVFAALAVLTSITVAISYTGMGQGIREVFALLIATVKMVLVASLFIHLRFEPRIIVVFALAPLVLALFFILAIHPDVGIAG